MGRGLWAALMRKETPVTSGSGNKELGEGLMEEIHADLAVSRVQEN